MSEMVERVARALFRCGNDFFDDGDPSYAHMSHLNSEDPDHWRSKARAAIAEMRDPTDDMIQAAWNEAPDGGALDTWQAMIDEVLR